MSAFDYFKAKFRIGLQIMHGFKRQDVPQAANTRLGLPVQRPKRADASMYQDVAVFRGTAQTTDRSLSFVETVPTAQHLSISCSGNNISLSRRHTIADYGFRVMDDQNRFLPPIELLIVIAINLAVGGFAYYAFRLWGLFGS